MAKAPVKKTAAKSKTTRNHCFGKCGTCGSPCVYDKGHSGDHKCPTHA